MDMALSQAQSSMLLYCVFYHQFSCHVFNSYMQHNVNCDLIFQVRYISDCKEFYGRVLDNHNVVSSVGETSRRESGDIWKSLYPGEPYELDFSTAHQDFVYGGKVGEKCTRYDLLSAVQRQSPFFYQVNKFTVIFHSLV